jgi:hypothetical protein
MRGYAITAHIHNVSDQLLRVEKGSLYRRCIAWSKAGWVRAEWARLRRIARRAAQIAPARLDGWKRMHPNYGTRRGTAGWGQEI